MPELPRKDRQHSYVRALGASPLPRPLPREGGGEVSPPLPWWERGKGRGGAEGDTATVFKVKRFFMQCLPVDNVAPTQCSI